MAFSSCTLSLFRAFAHTVRSARCAGLQTPQGAGSYPGVGGVSGRVLPFNDASIEAFLDDPCKNCPFCYFLIENNILPSEYISVCKDSHVCTYSGNLCHPHGDRSSLRAYHICRAHPAHLAPDTMPGTRQERVTCCN